MLLHFAKWKIYLVLAISLLGIAFALPNLFSRETVESLPDWLPKKQLNLGLDLQGGSHLLLEMDDSVLVKKWLESVRSDVREKLWKDNRISHIARVTKDSVVITIRDPKNLEKAQKVLESSIIQPIENTFFGGTIANNFKLAVNRAEGKITLTPTPQAIDKRVGSAVGFAMETVRRRVDALGTTEPIIQRQGKKRILVQVPGFDDPEALKGLLNKTGSLSFQLVDPSISMADAATARVPFGSERVKGREENGFRPTYILKKRVIVSGEDLVDAQPGFDQRTTEPIVTFRFNHSGATRFGRVTQKNVGQPFAIVLDNEVISAPRINEPILGGSGQISGNFTVASATELAILLRSGALPAPLTIVEERTVGPSLGKDSVDAGFITSILGLALVLVFIIVTYGTFGIYANIALVINLALLLGILSQLQATLTLPGIAGIVLTIGMAVDANVLIFERIREELQAGKTPLKAIDMGYSRALGTILDANITTFLAAAILFWLGSGPVKGFAVTLSIGIVTSVFTAFTLTRLLVSFWVKSQQGKLEDVPI